MLPLREHPQRRALAREAHARPYESLQAPVRVSHLALVTGEGGAGADHAHLSTLCEAEGVPTPPREAKHHAVDLGWGRLRWERHTEFSTYTFIVRGGFRDPFGEPPLAAVPRDWLAGLPGELLVALHLAMRPRTAPVPTLEELGEHLAPTAIAGSRVAGGAAYVWSDFRLHADGFGRILVHDRGLRGRQAGRLVQRLLEIETYRMMALLALPLARTHGPALAELDGRLAEVTARLASPGSLEDERALLTDLTAMAAAVERIGAETAYRFGAAAAYHDLVRRRIAELREERIPGLQTIEEFMTRRLEPAMATCRSVNARREEIAERIARAANLLRTRIDIALEEQNRDLLASMDRRARLQLRLQETVEGLSVVVLSYYLVSLVGYAAKAAKAAGLPLDPALATGFAIPVVVGAVGWGIQRMRRRLMREEGRRHP
ncbi:DUF3422 family protein [Inmirania thermothiophila]|uniref:Putative membrane-anchored protein n=1 Tax=Inmirania thermothiophila TaxID=1750597 RepID=A0A3N1Y0H3_9GAMM|nr:DUF3422 domain-containing protein [Inmirania thermothiophila]ROR32345.1 putative membrane-anchored protein [Inmirania thermothiophila]